jgi:hypothetical protein
MHKSKECIRLIRQAEKVGFHADWKRPNQVCMLYPPDRNIPPRLIHVGPAAVMPLKGFLRKCEKLIDTLESVD